MNWKRLINEGVKEDKLAVLGSNKDRGSSRKISKASEGKEEEDENLKENAEVFGDVDDEIFQRRRRRSNEEFQDEFARESEAIGKGRMDKRSNKDDATEGTIGYGEAALDADANCGGRNGYNGEGEDEVRHDVGGDHSLSIEPSISMSLSVPHSTDSFVGDVRHKVIVASDKTEREIAKPQHGPEIKTANAEKIRNEVVTIAAAAAPEVSATEAVTMATETAHEASNPQETRGHSRAKARDAQIDGDANVYVLPQGRLSVLKPASQALAKYMVFN